METSSCVALFDQSSCRQWRRRLQTGAPHCVVVQAETESPKSRLKWSITDRPEGFSRPTVPVKGGMGQWRVEGGVTHDPPLLWFVETTARR